jgi:MoaA/NifB/PqqE/SkfB family radical SAM enzyme
MIVVWRVTEHCNLSCKFCGYDCELERPRREADPKRIRQLGALFAEYQACMAEPVLISWLGGEPLLWPQLQGLSETFRREYLLKVSTTTNGTCLSSPKVREHLLDCYSELTISVDGIGAVHDRLRGWPGGYASLERNVMKLATEKQTRGSGLVLRANALLMRQTIGELENLCLKLARWGIEEITVNQLGGNDRPEFYPEHRMLPEQVEWLCTRWPDLRARLISYGVRLRGGAGYLKRLRASAVDEPLPIDDCRPGQHFLFIDVSGEIAPCSFTVSGYGVPSDEIKSVDDLIQLPARFSNQRLRRRLPPCEDCHSTQVFEKFAA